MRGGLERWQPCDSRGNSLACTRDYCQRVEPRIYTEENPDFIRVIRGYFFLRFAALRASVSLFPAYTLLR